VMFVTEHASPLLTMDHKPWQPPPLKLTEYVRDSDQV